jgi:hypothetical protein
MGEGVGYDVALLLPHDPVVSHRGGRVDALLDVLRVKEVCVLLGEVRPYAGQKVGLQLYPNRELVELPLVYPASLRFVLIRYAEQVLHVVTDLVSENVGQREVSRRAIPLHIM